jgi:hypothetical protein
MGFIGFPSSFLLYLKEELCGHCAEPHNTRQCRKKEEDPNFAPKYALCKGPHTAWSNTCYIRQAQLARVKQARRNRPTYYSTRDSDINSYLRMAQNSTRPRATADSQPRKRPAEQAKSEPAVSASERRILRPRTTPRPTAQSTR